MRLEALTVVEAVDVPLRSVTQEGFGPLLAGEEVTIHPSEDGLVTLAQGEVRVLARGAGRRGIRALRELPKADRRLALLTAADTDAAVVRVLGFGRALHLPNEVLIVRLTQPILE